VQIQQIRDTHIRNNEQHNGYKEEKSADVVKEAGDCHDVGCELLDRRSGCFCSRCRRKIDDARKDQRRESGQSQLHKKELNSLR
jgi:hypothetical protein